MNVILKIRTVFSLGLINLLRIVLYRFGIITKLNPVLHLDGEFEATDWFGDVPGVGSDKVIDSNLFHFQVDSRNSKNEITDWFYAFDVQRYPIPTGSGWFKNVLTGSSMAISELPWFKIPDFNDSLGDIKGIWEASRLGWMFPLARAASAGEPEALCKLNFHLLSWSVANPPYYGVNWKCGQEASIRVMHLAMVAILLRQTRGASRALQRAIKLHLQRIAPTISYAVAQDNNHGTSEAAALFIGGSWLVACGDKSALCWQKMGRKWLENRAKHLIEKDGTFSQYSVNYHRVMLDTYSTAELWRRELGLSSFSPALYTKVSLATRWLYQLTQPLNGDVPNLGHNDGARLLPLCDSSYRDFRSSVQLASVLFQQASAWLSAGTYDGPLTLLGLIKPDKTLGELTPFHFEQGGFIGLRSNSGAFALFRYPKFRFRPAQNDALHVDLWLDGVNLLRDGGTFSYNAGQSYIDYYGGTQSHNTIQFDEHDQMPRLSRFLLGAWLKAQDVRWDRERRYGCASYRDYMGCQHKREVSLSEKTLLVVDEIKGVQQKAILRWRLAPGEWVIEGTKVTNNTHTISIDSTVTIRRFELVEGKESRYYYQETSIPVLEVEVALDGKIITEYKYQ